MGTEAAAEDLQSSTAAALNIDTETTFVGGHVEEEEEGVQDITIPAESDGALIDSTAAAAAAATAVPSSANRSEDLLE